jgi:hypothetical protein
LVVMRRLREVKGRSVARADDEDPAAQLRHTIVGGIENPNRGTIPDAMGGVDGGEPVLDEAKRLILSFEA